MAGQTEVQAVSRGPLRERWECWELTAPLGDANNWDGYVALFREAAALIEREQPSTVRVSGPRWREDGDCMVLDVIGGFDEGII